MTGNNSGALLLTLFILILRRGDERFTIWRAENAVRDGRIDEPARSIMRFNRTRESPRPSPGLRLLKDALGRVIQVSSIVGVRALLVHAKDEEAMGFYTHYGFAEFPIGTQTLFLPIETIISAI